MKLCHHIGYYNDPEDIIDIFPSADIKPDMGDIVFKYMQDGYGNFHNVNPGGEVQPFEDFEDELGYTAILTSDGKHLVLFTEGNWKLLAKGSDQHGYYIDIWEVFEQDEEEVGNEFSGMSDNEILDLASTLSENLKNVIAEIKRRKLL